jgi:hypothetical protein
MIKPWFIRAVEESYGKKTMLMIAEDGRILFELFV